MRLLAVGLAFLRALIVDDRNRCAVMTTHIGPWAAHFIIVDHNLVVMPA